MPFVLLDVFHVTVHVPSELPAARAEAVSRALGQPSFLRLIRQAVRRALAGISAPVVVRLSR
jgi:hypothetical protein